LAGVGLAVVLSFIIIFLLRLFVGVIVWASILGLIVVLSGLGVIFLYNRGALSSYLSYTGSLSIPTLTSSSYYNYYGYAIFGVVWILLLWLVWCWGRIRLAILKAAVGFITRVPQTIFFPVLMSVLIVGFWSFALVVIVYLMGSTSYDAVSSDVFSSIGNYSDQKLIY